MVDQDQSSRTAGDFGWTVLGMLCHVPPLDMTYVPALKGNLSRAQLAPGLGTETIEDAARLVSCTPTCLLQNMGPNRHNISLESYLRKEDPLWESCRAKMKKERYGK